MLTSLSQLKVNYQLHRVGAYRFRPRQRMSLEFGSYILKTAESFEELLSCFKLRDEVFNKEFRGLSKTTLDFDQYDSEFDHLLIIHRPSSKVVGTYRLTCRSDLDESYTGNEFKLQGLLSLGGPFLELGRACIQQNHRKGAVISLLWRGIAVYMKLTGSQILFGCSSLKVIDSRRAALVYRFLENQGALLRIDCQPTPGYRFEDIQSWMQHFSDLNQQQIEEAESLVPSLLKSYLKLGAKVAAEPAYDRDFGCLDFLTVLRRHELSAGIERKFAMNESTSNMSLATAT